MFETLKENLGKTDLKNQQYLYMRKHHQYDDKTKNKSIELENIC